MKLIRFIVFALAALLALSATPTFAKGSKGSPVHVKGYTKKDGTYVAPHYRSAPNKTKADNWSTKGNVNPYTGKEGTKNPEQSVTAPASGVSAPRDATPQPGAAGNAVRALTGIPTGAAPSEVLKTAGEPNIKTANRWFYKDRGWVTFENGRVSNVSE